MAGMIKKEDVERVRNAADLYDIVSATVALKPSGVGAYVGLCPFHDERTPSFNVRPSVGSWHCFGCGRGGDVFKFVQEQENIDFREAVELLADKYHIELHYENAGGANDSHRGTKRARLLEANEEAQKFFVSQILTEEALPARKLLAGRNFSQQDCARFGCGYAPQGWDNLKASPYRQGLHPAGDARRRARAPRPGAYTITSAAVPHGPFATRPAVPSGSAPASSTTTIQSPRNTSTRPTPSSTTRTRRLRHRPLPSRRS